MKAMESADNEKSTIIPYRTSMLIAAILIALALTSVFLTRIYLGTLTVAAALIIAVIKSSLVLRYFMHLKFESRMFTIGVICVSLLISSVIIVTFLDYLYR
jgi:cytochrome c oxidase subunit IV